MYKDIDELWKKLLSSSPPATSQPERLSYYNKMDDVLNKEIKNTNNNIILDEKYEEIKQIKLPPKVHLGDAYMKYYINEGIKLKRKKKESILDEEKISNIKNKILKLNKKITKKIILDSELYKHNRNTIRLYSNIYNDYLNKNIDKEDIENIKREYNIRESNISRFMGIMKIFNEISKNEEIMNSSLFFSYWNFKVISLKINIIPEIIKMIN
jgi:hypothetical protein